MAGLVSRALKGALTKQSRSTGVCVEVLQATFARGFAGEASGPAPLKQHQYRDEMSKLRKAFQDETKKQLAAEAEKKVATQHAQAELRAQRKDAEGARRMAVDARVAAEREEVKAYMAEVRKERAARRELRELALQVAREWREEDLIIESATWIRKDEVDDRIRDALDRPESLY